MLRIGIYKFICSQGQQSSCSPIISLASRFKPSIRVPEYNVVNQNVRNYHNYPVTQSSYQRTISNHPSMPSNVTKTSSSIKLARQMSTDAEAILDQSFDENKLNDDRSYHGRIDKLERAMNRFEEKCQRVERVDQVDFVKIFDLYTKTIESLETNGPTVPEVKVNLALLAGMLLRCCGRLMYESDQKTRELLAGNLWHFIKVKKIPADTAHYNSLIRVLNENSTDFDPEKILNEMSMNNLTPDRVTYQRLIHRYCTQGDIEKATKLLEKMKDLGLELNEQTFASLIIGYGKQENPPSVMEMFNLMRTNLIEPSNKSYSAAIISLAQLLSKKPEAEEELKKVFETIEKEDMRFTVHEMIDMLASLNQVRQNETANEIFDFLIQKPLNTYNERYRFYDSLMKHGLHKEVSQIFWKTAENNISKGYNTGVYYLRIMVKNKEVPLDHILEMCSKFEALNVKAFENLYYYAANHGRLDICRLALKELIRDRKLSCHYYWPLLAQAQNEEEIIYTLTNDLNPKMDSQDLIETFSRWIWPRFQENFGKVFDLNKEKLHYDNNLIMASFLSYSVQNNKITEAIKFISEAPQEMIDHLAESQVAEQEVVAEDRGPVKRVELSNDKGHLMTRLLNYIAEQTKDPELVKKAFKLCQVPGQKVPRRALNPLVNVYLVQGDYENAIKTFLEIAEEYRYTPCKADLIIHCLEKKDPENLQKIMHMSNEIYGDTNSLFDLALCCLQCGKLKQAKKIFDSPNFRINPLRIYNAGKLLARNNKIEPLENFIHLTRDMYDVNQETLYQMLLDLYERTSNGKRVLDLWNRMQEEEFQPSKRSLLMIADVLEKNGIPVPFQKPNMRI